MPITNPKNNQQQDSKVQKTDCASNFYPEVI